MSRFISFVVLIAFLGFLFYESTPATPPDPELVAKNEEALLTAELKSFVLFEGGARYFVSNLGDGWLSLRYGPDDLHPLIFSIDDLAKRNEVVHVVNPYLEDGSPNPEWTKITLKWLY